MDEKENISLPAPDNNETVEANRKRETSSEETSNSNSEFKDTRESLDRDLGSSLSSSAAAANDDSNRNSSEPEPKNLPTEDKSGESSYEDLVEEDPKSKDNSQISEPKLDSTVDQLSAQLEGASLKSPEKTAEKKPTGSRRRSNDTPESGTGVPETVKKGGFYQHDSRGDEDVESKGAAANDAARRKSPERWAHDKFQSDERDRKPLPQRKPKQDKRPLYTAKKPDIGEIKVKSEPQTPPNQRDTRNKQGGNQIKSEDNQTPKSDNKGLSLSEYIEKSGVESANNQTEPKRQQQKQRPEKPKPSNQDEARYQRGSNQNRPAPAQRQNSGKNNQQQVEPPKVDIKNRLDFSTRAQVDTRNFLDRDVDPEFDVQQHSYSSRGGRGGGGRGQGRGRRGDGFDFNSDHKKSELTITADFNSSRRQVLVGSNPAAAHFAPPPNYQTQFVPGNYQQQHQSPHDDKFDNYRSDYQAMGPGMNPNPAHGRSYQKDRNNRNNFHQPPAPKHTSSHGESLNDYMAAAAAYVGPGPTSGYTQYPGPGDHQFDNSQVFVNRRQQFNTSSAPNQPYYAHGHQPNQRSIRGNRYQPPSHYAGDSNQQ